MIGIRGVRHPVLDEGAVILQQLEILDVVPGVVVLQYQQQAAVLDVQGVHFDALPLLKGAKFGDEVVRDAQGIGHASAVAGELGGIALLRKERGRRQQEA